ncbi:MAG: hypothetical protein ABIO43_07255 [Sphingomicrobium sp.]
MTIAELIAGSTYPFAGAGEGQLEGCSKKHAAPANWIISEPYDIVYIHRRHELVRSNLGGPGFLLAITASSSDCRVNGLRITFQNRALSADEAVTQASALQEWFHNAAFREPTEKERDQDHLPKPFAIEQVPGSPPLSGSASNLAEVRTLLVDKQVKVMRVAVAQLISDNTIAEISIENVRRSNEEITGRVDEADAAIEMEYYIYLDVGPRDQS